MLEANPVKYYFVKYFFLVVAVVQLVTALSLFYFTDVTAINLMIVILLFTLALVLGYVFLKVNDKVKRVAIGNNKVVVFDEDHILRFAWSEIRSLSLIPVLNLYKIKVRGKRGSIYFLSSESIRKTLASWKQIGVKKSRRRPS